MNLEFEYLHYTKEDNPEDLFKFCLDSNLYKPESESFKSRMKAVYDREEKEYDGISAVIAYREDKPIGICLLEARLNENGETFHHQAGIKHLDNRNRNNIWKRRFNFHFIHMGFISFYVKPEFRNMGIASDMLYGIEKIIKKRLDLDNFPNHIKENMADNYIVVTAKELAYKIVEKSPILFPINSDTRHGSYTSDISSLTYKIEYMDMKEKNIGENFPEYQENKKKKFNIF